MKHGGALWARHPHVRSGARLTIGERAGDLLKQAFGTWTLLGAIAAGIILWILFIHDPSELHLNLTLSCMAAVQGIILQIAANRIDRVNAESALHHSEQTGKIQDLVEQNTTLTQEVETQTRLLKEIHAHVSAITPEAGTFPPGEVQGP